MTKIARYLFGVDAAKRIPTRPFDGEYWYMALAICNLLGIENHSQAVHRERDSNELTLEETEFRKETIYIGGYGKKHVLMVNDNGMLKLIFQGTSRRAREVQARAKVVPREMIPANWTTEILTR